MSPSRTYVCTDCGPEVSHVAKPMGRIPTRCPDHALLASRRASNASARRWQTAHPEKAAENNRRWREDNREKAAQKSAKWRKAHPEKMREARNRWRAANSDKVRAGERRYRETLKSAPSVPFTEEQWAQKVAYWSGRCHICGLPGADSRDHVKPLSAGGWHCLANLRPAHRNCNTGKGANWPHVSAYNSPFTAYRGQR